MAAQESAESILCFLTVVNTRGETGIKSCKQSLLLLGLGDTILQDTGQSEEGFMSFLTSFFPIQPHFCRVFV